MKCPKCKTNFITIESQGVIIDCCQKCLGKWLVYGKLDQIIENSRSGYISEKEPIRRIDNPFQGENYDSEGHHGHDGSYSGHKRRIRRKGAAGKKFDF